MYMYMYRNMYIYIYTCVCIYVYVLYVKGNVNNKCIVESICAEAIYHADSHMYIRKTLAEPATKPFCV